jgi:hypothetical protein
MNDKTNRPADQRRDGATRGALLAAGRQLELIAPSASPEEAAAIVAALERFMRATAPGPAAPAATPDQWRRAAILEGVRREDEWGASDPWINT